MIFYFTGTGNSRWIAEMLGRKLNENLVSINDLIKGGNGPYEFAVNPEERILLVFPVYTWGVPYPVLLFIDRLHLKNAEGKKIYAVATCGDTAGLADRILKEKLEKNNLQLASFHTVSMPNCYILIPGFDVDSKEVARGKVDRAEARIDLIVNAVREERQDYSLYSKGTLSWFKSRVIYPAFIHNTFKSKFYATDACNHCGLCEKLCPMNNIILKDGIPQWRDKCVQCVACIHHCPKRAIEYGKSTQGKGRYYFKEQDY